MSASRRSFFRRAAGAAGAALLAPSLLARADGTSASSSLGDFTIERAVHHLDAVAFVLRAPDGSSFQVDVLARGSARSVASTARYDLFLANRGSGRTPSNELHGQGLLALRDWLEAQEDALRWPALVTFEERRRRHPAGSFTV